eukprot:CAMPEP_0174365546 /NCGR_PEP_ID=MMETSP0811_2-20130205/77561_1 /TAXON_ID=73025 ORGANISM="Eutreptiella gymnastica-like, Strain CCMP1594" /NCGR_SAMPLE_ID=MMETSP0811_2 /ASSEMBLY_ACC=CAM_ASM_000667 /LENGTH=108 /DNA_ID=CAMNT_0015506263 /DNA_START=758 /DNA_END=1084 /DNA_ORIENTATION=-
MPLSHTGSLRAQHSVGTAGIHYAAKGSAYVVVLAALLHRDLSIRGGTHSKRRFDAFRGHGAGHPWVLRAHQHVPTMRLLEGKVGRCCAIRWSSRLNVNGKPHMELPGD